MFLRVIGKGLRGHVGSHAELRTKFRFGGPTGGIYRILDLGFRVQGLGF